MHVCLCVNSRWRWLRMRATSAPRFPRQIGEPSSAFVRPVAPTTRNAAARCAAVRSFHNFPRERKEMFRIKCYRKDLRPDFAHPLLYDNIRAFSVEICTYIYVCVSAHVYYCVPMCVCIFNFVVAVVVCVCLTLRHFFFILFWCFLLFPWQLALLWLLLLHLLPLFFCRLACCLSHRLCYCFCLHLFYVRFYLPLF